MRSFKNWLGLTGVALVLALGNWVQASRSVKETIERVSPLIESEFASSLSVAAISIRSLKAPDSSEYLYVRAAGMWRCATTFGAVGDGPALEALLTDFTGATAAARNPSAGDAAFGLESNALRVSFHGPQVMEDEERDTLLAFDVGRSLPAEDGGGRSYLRIVGESTIYEIDADPRERIAWDAASRIPPLLDRKIIGGPWPGREFGFARVTIERAGDAPLVLFHEKLPPTGEGADAAWRWTIQGESSRTLPRERVLGFTGFCLRATWQGFANPAEARDLGLLPPAAKVTFEPFAATGAEPIELLVGPPTPQGSSLLFHRQNKMLFVIDAETARLYAPTKAMWIEGERNPWELWLAR